jgi:ABC-type multidrug transport system ATPase subunit
MSETEFVIQTKGLGKSYDGVHALKNLDLHVPDKAIFAFLGPNGAGKTTTIKLLLGLVLWGRISYERVWPFELTLDTYPRTFVSMSI